METLQDEWDLIYALDTYQFNKRLSKFILDKGELNSGTSLIPLR